MARIICEEVCHNPQKYFQVIPNSCRILEGSHKDPQGSWDSAGSCKQTCTRILEDPEILQDPVRTVARILEDPGIVQDAVGIVARILQDPARIHVQGSQKILGYLQDPVKIVARILHNPVTGSLMILT